MRKKIFSILFTLVLVLSFSLVTAVPVAADPAEWYVDASVDASGAGTSSETAFKTIQEGVNAAGTGHTVSVAAGIYNEEVNITTSNIFLLGEDRETAVIDAGGVQWGAIDVTDASHIVISGFTLRNSGTATQQKGVNITGTSQHITIEDCKIYSDEDGIRVHNNRADGFHTFRNNIISSTWNGIQLEYTSQNTVTQNTISNATGWAGINLGIAGDDNTVQYNVISGCKYGVNLVMSDGGPSGNVISNNEITNNERGIWWQGGPSNTVTENNIYGNTYNLYAGTTVVAENNWWGQDPPEAAKFYGSVDYDPWSASPNPVVPPPVEVWVDDDASPEWYAEPTNFDNIADAIGAVAEGGTISVAAGDYGERLTISKSLDLCGAQHGVDPTPDEARTTSADESIIDITGLGDKNPNVAVEIAGGVSNVSVAGFTLIGGSTSQYADESVIRCWEDDIVIEDNIIDGKVGVLYKGGDTLTVHQNSMVVNKNGVVVQPNAATDVTISDNLITLGSSPAGDEVGIYMTSCSESNVTGNTATGFIHNAALAGSSLDQLTVSGNTFTGNAAGISIWGGSTFITISNNDLSDSLISSWSDSGCGICIKGADLVITSNQIANNADKGVKIDYHEIATERVTISNNNIVGNTNYGVWVNTSLVTETVDATNNWWGSANGPTHSGNTFNVGDAQGDKVSDNVDYVPWLDAAYPGGASFAPVTTTDPVGSFASIQAGVTASNSNGTVNVAAGIYNENVVVPVDKPHIKLIGAGSDVTTISITTGAAIKTAAPITVEGFHIQGPGRGTGDALFLRPPTDDGEPTSGTEVNPGVFKDNKVTGVNYGVKSGDFNIHHWDFLGNDFSELRIGIGLENTSYVKVIDNTFKDYKEGVSMTWGAGTAHHVEITDNQFLNDGTAGDELAAIVIGSAAQEIQVLRNQIKDSIIGVLIKQKDATVPALTNVNINWNNIQGNTDGVLNEAAVSVDAKYNWWGRIGGPGGEGLGNGDNVTANVVYDPWLTEDYATTIDEGIAYFGSTISLEPGWNTLSVPLKLKDSANTMAEIVGLGDFLISSGTAKNWEIAYQYKSGSDWENIGTSATELVPLRGYYIKILGTDTVDFPVLYSGQLSLPTLKLSTDWNLIGSGFGIDKTGYGIAATDDLEDGQKDVATALYSIKDKCSVVVSPSTQGQVAAWGTTVIDSDKVMIVGEAYWVFMTTPVPTLAGFEVTPIYDLP